MHRTWGSAGSFWLQTFSIHLQGIKNLELSWIEICLKNLCSRVRHRTGATCVPLYSYCFPGRDGYPKKMPPFASCQNEIPKMFRVSVSQKCHHALIEYIALGFTPREMLTFTSGRLEFSGAFRHSSPYDVPINSILIILTCLVTVNETAMRCHTLFRNVTSFVVYIVYLYMQIRNLLLNAWEQEDCTRIFPWIFLENDNTNKRVSPVSLISGMWFPFLVFAYPQMSRIHNSELGGFSTRDSALETIWIFPA